MVPSLIKLFNVVAVEPDEIILDPEEVNFLAAKCGYLVHPKACTYDVMEFLKSIQANFNTTFYESWNQVYSLDEAQMRILQLIHYLTTYGTDYEGPTFTMNNFPEEMRFTDLKIIMPCSHEELFNRIKDLLRNDIALNTSTIDSLIEQLFDYKEDFGWNIDPEEIKNKEARTWYYVRFHKYPYDPFELMRIFMYNCRGNTMIINDSYTTETIKTNVNNLMVDFSYLDENHLKALASVFYRYKKIFLTMRHAAKYDELYCGDEMVIKINRVRRLARKYHKPFVTPVLQAILENHSDDKISSALQYENSTFFLVRVLNYLNSFNKETDLRTFLIRNGKIFIKKTVRKSSIDHCRINKIRQMVKGRISELLKDKAFNESGLPRTVRFPKYLELAAPVSEKMFIGSIPYGSSFRLNKNNYIGIYWRNEWGTRDFDLWAVGDNGLRIGWDGDHKNENILFSGDMTDADPEATEVLYGRDKWPDCIISVNRYNGKQGSKFRLFFGTDDLQSLPKNYMVNPDSIQISEDLISDSTETKVGIVHDNVVYFAALGSSESKLPNSLEALDISYEKAFYERISSFTTLREILLDAGFKEFQEENDTHPDIDLSGTLSKDTLISLLAPNS